MTIVRESHTGKAAAVAGGSTVAAAASVWFAFWFAWSDSHPQTELYGDATG